MVNIVFIARGTSSKISGKQTFCANKFSKITQLTSKFFVVLFLACCLQNFITAAS